jgi:septum formation protein
METIILASSSPRRKEILRSLSVPFDVVHPDIDESTCDHLEPEHRVVALAELKAAAGLALLSEERARASGPDRPSSPPPLPRLLLASDTLVALRRAKVWQTIGKPSDRDEARAMLRLLAGRTHTVFTGLCLADTGTGERSTICATTAVRFSAMSDIEIERYLDSEEWHGAAGAYRLQGRGSCFIEQVRGSWSCVVGLPIRELYGMLRGAGYDFGEAGRISVHPLVPASDGSST